MIAQRADIDPHEGDAEQKKDRLGDERLEQFAERRHGDADEHQRRDGAGALATDPCQGAHGQGHALSQIEWHPNLARKNLLRGRDHAAAATPDKVTSRYALLPGRA